MNIYLNLLVEKLLVYQGLFVVVAVVKCTPFVTYFSHLLESLHIFVFVPLT